MSGAATFSRETHHPSRSTRLSIILSTIPFSSLFRPTHTHFYIIPNSSMHSLHYAESRTSSRNINKDTYTHVRFVFTFRLRLYARAQPAFGDLDVMCEYKKSSLCDVIW